MALTEGEAKLVIFCVSAVFADMCNPDNRGPKFTWSQSFPRIAAEHAKSQYAMSGDDYADNKKLELVQVLAEEYAITLVSRAGFLEQPKLAVCWCDYGATGEGSTLMFALGNTQKAAQHLFKLRFGDYFYQGAETVDGIPDRFRRMLPEYIIEMYNKIPSLEYYQCHHFNLS